MDEDVVKHLEMIQDIISRMSSIGMKIKGWYLTLFSTCITMLLGTSLPYVELIATVLFLFFWFLDASYLYKERRFRNLYDKVRTQSSTDFSMDIAESSAKEKMGNWIEAFVALYLLAFYCGSFFVLLVIVFLQSIV